METKQFKQNCLRGAHTFYATKRFQVKLPTYKEVIERVFCETN